MIEPYRVAQADALSLADIEAAVWQELRRAAVEPGHAWRRCTVATLGEHGPEARTMVLRECDAEAATLCFYTDARSPKVAQWAADPRTEIVCWSPTLNWQVRLRTQVEVETEGLGVSARWARVRFSPAAQDYLSHAAPGAPLGARPVPHVDAVAHHHFAVAVARVLAVDWLALHPAGHRRARFSGGERCWLAP
jgi:pyridoxamine 5'-phosphate oxidase